MTNLRIEMIKKYSKDKILDVGCSRGILHNELKKSFKEVMGLDMQILDKDANIIKGNAEKMPLPSNSFTTIVGGELIEHLKHPEKFISESMRVLKDGGTLIITTPNRDSWWNMLFHTYYHEEVEENLKFQNHVHVFNESELNNILLEAGFKVKVFDYITYEQDVAGNTSFIRMLLAFRKVMHKIVPRARRECMFVVAKKLNHKRSSRKK